MVSPIELQPDPELTSRFEAKCLVGKVINPNHVRESDVRSCVSADWKCRQGFTVSAMGHNMFMFCFQENQDLMRVLLNVPWNVKGGLLILSPWSPGQILDELDFNFSPFWVQVHGLPPNYLTRENGLKIGQTLGRFMYLDLNQTEPASRPSSGGGKLPERKFIRIRVVLDIRRSLLTGHWVKRVGFSDIWVMFKYEKLGRFCYKCGRIGKHFSTCEFPEVMAKFGPWLSVPPCLDAPAPLIRVPQKDTMLIEYPNLREENDEKNKEDDDSEEQILHADEKLSTRSQLQKFAVNSLDSMVMIVNSAIIHCRVAAATASRADLEDVENWRFFLENWKLFVVVVLYFAYLVWRLVRVTRNSWLFEAYSKGQEPGMGMGMGPGFMVIILTLFACLCLKLV